MDYMRLAIKEAEKAALRDEVPIGAVLVHKDGEILAAAGNRCETLKDPTAHAEMLVIREGAKKLGDVRLPECDLYVTCPMCATAISFARIRRLYFGAYDPKGGGVDHGPKIYTQNTCHHTPEVYSGIEEQACGNLLREFFIAKR